MENLVKSYADTVSTQGFSSVPGSALPSGAAPHVAPKRSRNPGLASRLR
jgi:hypothetical protein